MDATIAISILTRKDRTFAASRSGSSCSKPCGRSIGGATTALWHSGVIPKLNDLSKEVQKLQRRSELRNRKGPSMAIMLGPFSLTDQKLSSAIDGRLIIP